MVKITKPLPSLPSDNSGFIEYMKALNAKKLSVDVGGKNYSICPKGKGQFHQIEERCLRIVKSLDTSQKQMLAKEFNTLKSRNLTVLKLFKSLFSSKARQEFRDARAINDELKSSGVKIKETASEKIYRFSTKKIKIPQLKDEPSPPKPLAQPLLPNEDKPQSAQELSPSPPPVASHKKNEVAPGKKVQFADAAGPKPQSMRELFPSSPLAASKKDADDEGAPVSGRKVRFAEKVDKLTFEYDEAMDDASEFEEVKLKADGATPYRKRELGTSFKDLNAMSDEELTFESVERALYSRLFRNYNEFFFLGAKASEHSHLPSAIVGESYFDRRNVTLRNIFEYALNEASAHKEKEERLRYLEAITMIEILKLPQEHDTLLNEEWPALEQALVEQLQEFKKLNHSRIDASISKKLTELESLLPKISKYPAYLHLKDAISLIIEIRQLLRKKEEGLENALFSNETIKSLENFQRVLQNTFDQGETETVKQLALMTFKDEEARAVLTRFLNSQ